MLYYRLAEHINKYMSVVQYIVSTLSTKVGIQLLTMSVATMRRAHTAVSLMLFLVPGKCLLPFVLARSCPCLSVERL